MATRVQDRPGSTGSGEARLRHLFEGTQAGPPTIGAVALCGYRAKRFAGPAARPFSGTVEREHCVVCVELARSKGYGI